MSYPFGKRKAFEKLRALRAQSEKRWSFIDGPITANNPMGVHHAWGRTYKDLYQRFKAMQGYNQRWQNGFDCQGLWVEVNVERDLGFNSKREIEEYGLAKFVKQCKMRVLNYAATQTEQSIRLGYWMDWNDPENCVNCGNSWKKTLFKKQPSRVQKDRFRARSNKSSAVWGCRKWVAPISPLAMRTITRSGDFSKSVLKGIGYLRDGTSCPGVGVVGRASANMRS